MESLELLKQALLAAEAAGRAILEVYDSPKVSVREKADRSPLTEADLAAHRAIAERLDQLPFPLLSEEAESDHPFEVRRDWRTLWLVDPLDGTKEFLERNGQFTVNIALVQDHRPVLGVVHAPVLGATYFAAKGHGAFKLEGGERSPIATRRPATPPLRVVASRSHATEAVDRFLANLPFPYERLAIGSSLKFCLLAEGKADLYPRFGPTWEWDTAAAHAVLLEAGGEVVDLEGRPLRYNARPTLKNPPFLAYGDPSIPWRTFLSKIKID